MKKFIKKNFYYILILFFVTINFNSLEKFYLIYLNDYNERLALAYGYCDKEGYGFVKKNLDDRIIKSNFKIENKDDFPSIKGFFYKFNNNIVNETYIFLINQKKTDMSKNYLENYRILKNEGNCYLLKKND